MVRPSVLFVEEAADYHLLIFVNHFQQREIIRCEFQIAHWIEFTVFYPVGYLEFATDYFLLLEVVCKITTRPSGVVSNNHAHLRVDENNCTSIAYRMPIRYSCFSKTRGTIDNLTSQNATYEYEVETRIGG